MSEVETHAADSQLEAAALPAVVSVPQARPPRNWTTQRVALAGKIAAARVQRLGVLGIAGVAALSFFVTFVASALLPLHAHVVDLRESLSVASHSPRQTRLPPPQEQATTFIAGLPDRNMLPAVLASIVQQADTAGLSLDRGTYQWSVGKSGAIARYQLTLPVKGSYPAVRKFVDATLAEVPAAALAGLSLERPNVGDAQVAANLRFEIFTRSAP